MRRRRPAAVTAMRIADCDCDRGRDAVDDDARIGNGAHRRRRGRRRHDAEVSMEIWFAAAVPGRRPAPAVRWHRDVRAKGSVAMSCDRVSAALERPDEAATWVRTCRRPPAPLVAMMVYRYRRRPCGETRRCRCGAGVVRAGHDRVAETWSAICDGGCPVQRPDGETMTSSRAVAAADGGWTMQPSSSLDCCCGCRCCLALCARTWTVTDRPICDWSASHGPVSSDCATSNRLAVGGGWWTNEPLVPLAWPRRRSAMSSP